MIGRKKNSGQAALATDGDGWRKLARYPQTRGPFDRDPVQSGRPVAPDRCAAIAVERVKRLDT